MKKLITMLGDAALALLTSNCMEQHITISINKDGSGTITETRYFGDQIVAETDAKYLDGNQFTMMDVNLGELANKEDKLIEFIAAKPASMAAAIAMFKDLEGTKIQPAKMITLKLI